MTVDPRDAGATLGPQLAAGGGVALLDWSLILIASSGGHALSGVFSMGGREPVAVL